MYRLVLTKLDLPYVPQATAEDSTRPSRFMPPARAWFKKTMENPISPDPAEVPWISGEVSVTLKAIIHDQLQVDLEEIRECATFLNDLGCD